MSSEEVRYVSTSTIRPANDYYSNQPTRIELTPWDIRLLPLQYIQKGLLFTKPDRKQSHDEEETSIEPTRIELTPSPWDIRLLPLQYIQKGLRFTKPDRKRSHDEEETSIVFISHLKTSLCRTLDHFFPLAGRLAITKNEYDSTISVHINCNSTGAEFIHATADVTTIADILNPIYVPRLLFSLFPLNGVINYQGETKPLLSIQVTELKDGIFIGCSINHIVCDGISFWHFLNSWSEFNKSGCSDYNISRPPVFRRWFLDHDNCPISLPFSTEDERRIQIYTPPPHVEVRVFHFTSENIAKLTAKAANLDSSLHALLAHFWVAVTRARCLDPNDETSFRLAIDNRNKLNPPLPELSFCNSVQAVTATTKVGELLERGIELATLLLNEAVKSHTDAVIRRFRSSWIEKPSLLQFFNGSVPTLLTGGSLNFDVYGNDFGWGRPVAVRSGFANQDDGKMTIFTGPVEGSVDIEACFYPGTLKAMENDSEFMEAVTVLPHFQSF